MSGIALPGETHDRSAMRLTDVVNIAQIRGLLLSIEAAFGVPCTLVGAEDPVFPMDDRHPFCSAFHAPVRKDLESCSQRLKKLQDKVRAGKMVTTHCPMGLYDIAMPIMVEGKYVGALILGQFLTEEKDHEALAAMSKALEVPFDYVKKHTDGLPVIDEGRILDMGVFFKELATHIGTMAQSTLRRNRLEEQLSENGRALECQVNERTMELERSERRLKEAQHIARMGSFERDLASGEGWWSDEFYRLLGYEPGEVPCEREVINSHVHPEDRGAFLKSVADGLARAEPFTVEFRVITKQDEIRWFFADVSVTTDDFGKPVRYSGSFRDITKRKRIENELRSVNKLQQLILDNSIIGIALVRHHRFEWVNQRTADMAGLDVGEMTGASTRIIFTDDEQYDYLNRSVHRALSTGQSYDAVFEFRHPTRGNVWCRFVSSALNPDNPDDGAVWMFEDIMERRAVDIELRRSRRELESILQNSQVGIMFIQGDRFLVRCNQRLADIFGYNSPGEMEGMSVRMLHLNEDRYREFGEKFYEKLVHAEQTQIEYEMRRKDGSTVWCSLSGKAVDTASRVDLGKGVIWVIDDITVRKKAEAALRQSERRFRAIFTHAGVGICTLDRDGAIHRVNHRLCLLTGYEEYDLLGMNVADVTHPEDVEQDRELRLRLWIQDIPMYVREARYVRRDGKEIWGRVTTTVVRADDKTPQYLLQVVEDITERKRLEAELVRLAKTDSLTGLMNRHSFMERGDNEFARHRRYNSPMCVLLMDIDHFKNINDTHGHHIGDQVLKQLAETCNSILRKTDLFGRIGGEEFAMVLVESGLPEATGTAERIRREVENTVVRTEEGDIRFTVSIGGTELRQEDKNLEKTIQRADELMYEAKRAGRNKVVTR